jgi:hypothetical protein
MMNVCIHDSESTHRTAMALNNLGVSMMMEQGGLNHAMMLFKDSLAVMSAKHYIPHGGEFGDVFLPCTITQEQEIQQQQQQQHGQAASLPLHPLQICSSDDGDLSLMTKTLPNVSTFLPISLRSHHFYDPQGSPNLNLSLAIIMYNHGLAHLLAHVQDRRWHTSDHHINGSTPTTTQGEEHHGQKLQRGAVVSLNCAQVMIDRHLNTLGNDSFEKLETLLLSAMTIKTIMWMSSFGNRNREAEQARIMLSHVLGDINLYQERLRELNINTCNPATSAAA